MPNALHALLPRPATCEHGSTFVTLVSNASYVAGALCLRTALTRVGSMCPLLLVVADDPGEELPPASVRELTDAYGIGSVIRLSELRARLQRHVGRP